MVMNFKNKIRQNAFTLIELTVAITIFSVFIAVMSSSYLFITRMIRDTQVAKNVNAEVVEVIDNIVNSARVSLIDYDCYSGDINTDFVCIYIDGESDEGLEDGILKSSYLVLLSPEKDKRTIFRIKENKAQILKQTWINEQFVADDGFENIDAEPLGFKDLTSANVVVTEGKFYITPNKDPFVSFMNLQYQPQVTVKMIFESKGQVRTKISIPIKTTVT